MATFKYFSWFEHPICITIDNNVKKLCKMFGELLNGLKMSDIPIVMIYIEEK